MKSMKPTFYQKIVAHVNRKAWWHVLPQDLTVYRKRGTFLSSSFKEAEFWGRPLDEPQRVSIEKPLVGDEDAIEKKLFGKRVSTEHITLRERWNLDAKMKRAARARGYDSILLMSRKAFSEFKATGKPPRSLELNIFQIRQLKPRRPAPRA
jgi:hypothetical protein